MPDVPEFSRDRVRDFIEELKQEERERIEAMKDAQKARREVASLSVASVAVLISILSAAFTGWYAWEQRKTRIEAGQMSRESLHLAQRAYVGTDAHLGKNGIPIVEIHTWGNSPAAKTIFDLWCTYSRDPEYHHSSITFTPAQGQVLYPGSIIQRPCVISSSSDEPKYLLVIGSVSYEDVFSARHHTSFCYYVPAGSQPPQPMEACYTGNTSD